MRSCALGILMGLSLFCGKTEAAYRLDTRQSYPVEGTVWRVVVGDVTGDGRKDVVALSRNDAGISKIHVFAQAADGTLTNPPRIYSVPDAASLALGDLNRDGLLDVVVGGYSTITTLVSNVAAPVPLTMRTWTTDRISYRIQVLNMDRDGAPDVLSINGIANPLTPPYYFRGDGRGGLLPDPKPVTAASLDVSSGMAEVADVNGDGLPDILFQDFNAAARLLYSVRGRGYAAPVTIDPGFLVEKGVLADFNGDGRNDLVLAGATTGPTFLYVYPQQSSGERFPQAVSLSSANGLAFHSLLDDDLDGDGRTDLLVAHRTQFGLYVQGDAGLGAEVLQGAEVSETVDMAAGDVNGDGCKDVVVAGFYNDVNVLYGSDCVGTEPAPLPDLKVTLAATAQATVVQLATSAVGTPVQEPLVEIAAAVDAGTLQIGTLPANCIVQSQTQHRGQITCVVGTMTAASTTTLTIPLAVLPNPGVPARLEVSARAVTDTPELSLGNNAASTRISVPSTPVTGSMAIKRAPRPTETTQQRTRRPQRADER